MSAQPSAQELTSVGREIAGGVSAVCLPTARPSFHRAAPSPWKDVNNETHSIDEVAHRYVETQLRQAFGDRIVTCGEEVGPYPKTFEAVSKIIAIVDPIDGTELLARGLAGWGCAIAFFDPVQNKILSAVVAFGADEIFFADATGAFKTDSHGLVTPLSIPSLAPAPVRLEQASLCFVGQKPGALLSFVDHPGLVEGYRGFAQRMRAGERLSARVYNLGGNPALAKVADGSFDAVLELQGHALHDVVAGAFIARRAGAVLLRPTGEPLALEEAFAYPQETLSYLVARDLNLGNEIASLIEQRGPKAGSAQPA